MLQTVHGAVAEQAVEVRQSLVAGEIFTVFIFKKAIGILHNVTSSCPDSCIDFYFDFCSESPVPFLQNSLQNRDWTDNTDGETRETGSAF